MKVILHIGYYKTGTTALQHFCDLNRDRLGSIGVLYPTAGRPANDLGQGDGVLPQLSVLSLGLLETRGAHIPEWYKRGRKRQPHLYDPMTQWACAVEELKNSNCEYGLISSEEFIRFGESEAYAPLIEVVKTALQDFEVTVLCYLRRPDLYIESWYNQLIKIGVKVQRLRCDLVNYLDSIHIDYFRALKPWAEAFGQEQLLIRNYEEIKTLPHGILSEVTELFGCAIDDGSFNFKFPSNPSIPNALLEIKRLSNRWSKTPRDVHRANRAAHFLSRNWDLPANSEIELLDLAAREAIIQAFTTPHAELSKLTCAGTPFFRGFEDAVLQRTFSMSDTEAALRFSGLFQFALQHVP